MLGYLSLASCIVLSIAVNTANVESDVKSAVNEVTTTKDGDTYCPVPIVGTKCGSSSIFHYWKCCGDLNKECCLNFQVWLLVVAAVIGVVIVASLVLSLIRCLFCRS